DAEDRVRGNIPAGSGEHEHARRRARGRPAGQGKVRAADGVLMAVAYIEDIARHEGQALTIRGWLHNRRSSGKIHFLTVRDGRGFILADTPIFTPAACEGTTTLFPVQYFEDNTAYLTQSGQLYNEANAMALGRVYCFGPTFRAEKSKTRRHLTEFWMVEPEVA